MDEETEPKSAPFDAELEIIKLQGRFRWLVGELEEFRQKDRSLSARISRLKLRGTEEEGEVDLDDDIDKDLDAGKRRLENMSLEERAILIARLTDRE